MLSVYTKDGIRYIFDGRLAIAEDIVNGTYEYCYAHWLAKFTV
jgi:hypothetical protein